MPNSSSHPAAATASPDRRVTELSPTVASAALGTALVLGIAGDSLLALGIPGLGFPIFTALIVISLVALAWRAELAIPREAAAWLAVAVVCSAGVAWRDAEPLLFFDACATIGALLFAGAALNRAGALLLAPRLRETAVAILLFVRTSLIGIVPLALREAAARAAVVGAKGGLMRYARAGIMAAILLVVFGALLRSADPIFASLVSLPAFDAGPVIQHTVIIAFFTILIGGWARAALLAKSPVATGPALPFFRLTSLEINAALGTLGVLFAAYVLAQLGWFFGGERFLRERTGLTAAEYARGGFFQMVWVVALVVPLLVATRSALEPGRALARRHTLLSLPIVGLLGVMIVSAASRMQLYVHYFGLSIDRLYPLAVMAWLAVVLAWLALTVLRGYGRPFLAGAAASALATLFTLNVVSPDRIVARVNIERSERARGNTVPLDVRYLAQLSGEATDLVVRAVLDAPSPSADLTSRCEAAQGLLKRWGSTSSRREARDAHAAWRSWNAGDAAGLRAVAAQSAALRQRAHACPRQR